VLSQGDFNVSSEEQDYKKEIDKQDFSQFGKTSLTKAMIVARIFSIRGKRFFPQVRRNFFLLQKLKYDIFKLYKNSFTKFCSFKCSRVGFFTHF
jgi:hypothetical protein